VPASGDLPPYILRVNPRSRHVRLTVTPHEGLVVIVPDGVRGFDPTPILVARREWIADALAEFAEMRAACTADPADLLPSEVRFAATAEEWCVEYRQTRATRVTVRDGTESIVLSGAVDDARACLRALDRWLHARAAERLLPLLDDHARRAGLTYRKAGIRGQRSRWGSCSASGSITLNRCLLFLGPELVDSVVLHELAHLKQPNHSAAFWRELERLDPAARQHRRQIRNAWSEVPVWAEPWVLRGR